jgi:catechol 2,3-dioxygenase-like lactoylglutathione lyase family enzyme
MQLHHLAIAVRDLDVAETFYAGTLGMAVLSRQPGKSVWLDLGGAILMLEKGAGGAGTHVLALRIAREERAGWAAKVSVEGRTAYTIYTRDPDGNRIGLSHYPDPADG